MKFIYIKCRKAWIFSIHTILCQNIHSNTYCKRMITQSRFNTITKQIINNSIFVLKLCNMRFVSFNNSSTLTILYSYEFDFTIFKLINRITEFQTVIIFTIHNIIKRNRITRTNKEFFFLFSWREIPALYLLYI